MKMLTTLLVGAAVSLFASYFLLVTDAEVTYRNGDGGTSITFDFGNPDGPEPSSVPSPPVAAPTPVPAPEPRPLTAEELASLQPPPATEPASASPAPAADRPLSEAPPVPVPMRAEKSAGVVGLPSGGNAKGLSNKEVAASKPATGNARATRVNGKGERVVFVFRDRIVRVKDERCEDKKGDGGTGWGGAASRAADRR